MESHDTHFVRATVVPATTPRGGSLASSPSAPSRGPGAAGLNREHSWRSDGRLLSYAGRASRACRWLFHPTSRARSWLQSSVLTRPQTLAHRLAWPACSVVSGVLAWDGPGIHHTSLGTWPRLLILSWGRAWGHFHRPRSTASTLSGNGPVKILKPLTQLPSVNALRVQ